MAALDTSITGTYNYQTLIRSKRQIRLVEILNAERLRPHISAAHVLPDILMDQLFDLKAFRCKIHHVSLDESRQYIAIS
ncbi:Uncharacterized protein HZ326_24058 [Fusarium oxysporum f. sp. albedinis]|nr:Uncharacterized protein HZ326_24058 [Fusarium oxysporum f. sp. albedinis]